MTTFDATENRKQSVRHKILKAATKLMNEKGFKETSINEIAQSAGTVDRLIYRHFEGKEELLFSVVEEQMAKWNIFLEEHLQTIHGAENKLRKMIWAHLSHYDANRDYINLVLIECRTNQRFYESSAYKLIRKYARRFLETLKEGVREGVFRKDLNLVLVRDIIFGLLDFESISCLITHEIPESSPIYEDCMQLIQSFLFVYPEEKTPKKDKREIILKSAAQVFAELGYNDATISKIAGLAGVAEGTVYLYFKNKKDLFFSIAEEFFGDLLSKIDKYSELPVHARRMETFIQKHFSYYLSEHEYFVVYLMLVVLEREFYKSPVFQSYSRYMQVVDNIVKDGIAGGCFIPDLNIRVFRNLLFGAFTHVALRWFIVPEGSRYDKHSEADQFTKIIFNILKVNEYNEIN